MPPSLWVKTKGTSKKGFDKAWHALDKLGDPVNRLSNRVGAEAFWPMTTDKESDKAARILRSFCKDGFYADNETDRQSSESVISKDTGKIDKPKGKQRVLKKIPTKVIQQAKGLAIFTTMRTGLWLSGSGGSGVLLARIPETGEWSPPSGIMLHTAGVGFLAGIDIYDCVVVINTYEALEAFKKVRCTLGGEVSASAGPVGMGGVLESEVHKRQAPIWTYMKSRGLYAGVQVDGTIIIERTDENERFYGERISVTDILAGKARHPPASIQPLLQTIKAAQGDMDVNEDLLPPPGETPGDVELEPTPAFGVPDPEDPDPFGVKALEAEGLFIREAGSRARPSHDVFEFKPNPNSPVFATFRRSMESSQRNSWRTSVQSYVSQDRGTQTFNEASTAPTSLSRASSPSNRDFSEPKDSIPSDSEAHWETVIPEHHEANFRSQDKGVQENFVDDEDFEVHEVSSARISRPDSATGSPVSAEPPTTLGESMRQSPTFTRARLVTIPKRQPPSLPPRNPYRASTSTSTPASPIPWASSDDNRSVTSISTRASLGGPVAATDSVKKDSSAGASSVDEEPESHKASGSKDDEFHSVSSAHSSESAPEKEIGMQNAHSRSATPEDQFDTISVEEKATEEKAPEEKVPEEKAPEEKATEEKAIEGNATEEKVTDEGDKRLPQDEVSATATHS